MGCNCGGGRAFSAPVGRAAVPTSQAAPTSASPTINSAPSPGYAVASNPNSAPTTKRQTI